MSDYRLLIVSEDGKEYADKLAARAIQGLTIRHADTPQDIEAEIPHANIILAEPWLVSSHIAAAANLAWVQTTTVGVDALIKHSDKRDYILTNARGILGPKLTEYTFAYILAHKKRVFENLELQKRKTWDQTFTDSLANETIVILGTGSIGSHIAMVAKAFGMRTCGYRTEKKPVEHFDEIFGKNELSDALAQGDYVVSVLPSTADTNSIIRAETIAHMKKGVVFLNIGRGNAVVEEDLVAAVKAGKIARAILDVFKTEPLPQASPLWDTENIVVTSHVAGYAGPNAIVELFVENYKKLVAGEHLRYQVDFAKGY